MIWRRRLRSFHRWAGIVLGVQLLAWISGGVVMSAIPIDQVRGKGQVVEAADPDPLGPLQGLVPAAAVITGDTTELRLRATWRGRGWERHTARGRELVDAASGRILPPLDEAAARRRARALYAGDAAIVEARLLEEPPREARGRSGPLWRIRFDDRRATTLYLDPVGGELRAVRTDLWRLYDFFWMLHIMDYRARQDFNHPLLVGTALAAWVFALSGLALFWISRRRRAPLPAHRGGRPGRPAGETGPGPAAGSPPGPTPESSGHPPGDR